MKKLLQRLVFYAIKPRKNRLLLKDNLFIAHRGLHNDIYPENSIGAFTNAINNNYGIELDVHKTKDDNKKRYFIPKLLASNMFFNFLAKPDLISYNHKYSDSFIVKLCEKLYNADFMMWTLTSEKDFEKFKENKDCKMFIFEDINDNFMNHFRFS